MHISISTGSVIIKTDQNLSWNILPMWECLVMRKWDVTVRTPICFKKKHKCKWYMKVLLHLSHYSRIRLWLRSGARIGSFITHQTNKRLCMQCHIVTHELIVPNKCLEKTKKKKVNKHIIGSCFLTTIMWQS